MPPSTKTIKGVMKAQSKAKAKASPKASPKTSPKAPASPKKAAKVGQKKLTEEAVEEHTRAHEKLLGKGLKTPDEIIAELGKMPKKEQEQIWKQFLVCVQCIYIV